MIGLDGHPFGNLDHCQPARAREDRRKMTLLLWIEVAYQEQGEPRVR